MNLIPLCEKELFKALQVSYQSQTSEKEAKELHLRSSSGQHGEPPSGEEEQGSTHTLRPPAGGAPAGRQAFSKLQRPPQMPAGGALKHTGS